MLKYRRIIQVIFAVLVLLCITLPFHVQTVGESNVTSCLIDPNNTEQVIVSVNIATNITSDDGKLYLFAVPTYANDIQGYKPVASAAYTGNGKYQISANLNANRSNSLLYSKFYVATLTGGSYRSFSGGNYITNPEVVAVSQIPRTETSSKKGIHINMSIPTDLEELGIKHGYFNITFQDFISNTKTDISYDYNGKTYYFTSAVNDYDNLIGQMTKAGMAVTVKLRNEYRSGYEYMIHPDAAQRIGTSNYALNTSNQEGLNAVIAATHFLAERYNGTNDTYGKVDNWIVGNEVNDNLQYYYMGEQKLDTFVQDYLRSFRAVYTAIKSGYANANVYICLQHRWNVESSTGDYGGRDFIDTFNTYTKAQGNIDWGLSYHPYSFPMNDADILNDGEATLDQDGNNTFGNEVTDSIDTPIISMKNISLLTDYFNKADLLNPNGQVRSIILGEQGYTSYSNITGSNEAKQAANIALAYYIAEMNDNIDAFILRNHVDEDEKNEYFQFGLWRENAEGKPSTVKFAYEIYKYIDTEDSLLYTQFAKAALNINDWSDVIDNWDTNAFKPMGIRKESPLYCVSGSTVSQPVVSTMLGIWTPRYNVYDIGPFDYDINNYPGGTAVANEHAYYMDFQGVETHFDTPIDLSNSSYLTMDVNFKAKSTNDSADKLEVVVRLHSGSSVYDATGIVNVNTDYTLCLDLQQWEGKSAIDGMEVMIREYGKTSSFNGTFTVYNVNGANAVADKQALPAITKEIIDLSNAVLSFKKEFNYSGAAIFPDVTVKLNGKTLVQHTDYDVIYHNNTNAGQAKVVVVGIGNYSGYVIDTFTIQGNFPTVYKGVDYSPVYAYGYYMENNPAVVAEVGTDPDALLAHFVEKGMDYALQAKGDFNAMAYAKINDDVYAKNGDNWRAYYEHYLTRGIAEGRSTSGMQPEDMEPPVYPTVPEKPKDCTSGHTYDDMIDGTCNVCGINRADVETRKVVHMFRMYNPNTGEHFYTGSTVERDNLIGYGWMYEGVGFTFPANTGAPVYRLFHEPTGEHLYTMDEAEKNRLIADGWNYEGIAFNSAYDTEAVQHRLHNPNATVGAYHFTFSEEEKQNLINAGWEYQGIGWYSCWK